jgi:tetratricopeptide (TPR) repeat protein
MTGQLDQALSDCNESLRLRTDPYTLDSRGLVYLKLGQYDAAIADYDAVLKSVPDFPDSLYGRGMAKRKKGDGAGSDMDLTRAKALRADIAAEFARYGIK